MTESELAIEIHEEYQKDAFIKIDFNDLPKVNKEMYLKVARHVHKLILRGKIEELKVAQGKIALAAYHAGQEVDLSWIDHRIEELEGKLSDG